MEHIQNTEMVAYVNQRVPLEIFQSPDTAEVFQLPYTGAKEIHLSSGKWMTDQFEFSFSCGNGTEARVAFEIEKNDSSQMFFYGVVPNSIAALYVDQSDPAITIREMMIPVTAACGIYFDQGSAPLLGNRSIEVHGECDHATLGHGTWKGEIQVGNDCCHVLVSVSFNELNNDAFFEQVQSEYLSTSQTESVTFIDCQEVKEECVRVPVIDLSEHLRIMDLIFEDGMDETLLLGAEAKGVADEAEKMIRPDGGIITLLVGKGHNGANAIEAGHLLLQKGYQVQAVLMVPLDQCDPLSQQLAVSFLSAGGTVEVFHQQPIAPGLIIDGLVGTAFKGVARGILKEMILAANASGHPILAIDVPSGLNAETGEGDIAILATRTASMGFPKFGFFMNRGLEAVGQLSVVDLGIPDKVMNQLIVKAYLMTEKEAKQYVSHFELSFSRQQVEEMIQGEANWQNIQAFVDKGQQPLVMKDPQTVIFRPNEKPIICC